VARGGGGAWGSVAAGAGSVVTLPVAIYLTRFSDAYELLDAAFAIPVAVALGVLAIALARRAQRREAATLLSSGSARGARAGRVLGIVGLCMAASGLVAIGVYGLLEYVGSRD
jgi:hypothetical protein